MPGSAARVLPASAVARADLEELVDNDESPEVAGRARMVLGIFDNLGIS